MLLIMNIKFKPTITISLLQATETKMEKLYFMRERLPRIFNL